MTPNPNPTPEQMEVAEKIADRFDSYHKRKLLWLNGKALKFLF